ncbi:hypothetical protein FZEAL_5401 [Fusarium zealandicum]|uniref:Uncharacterized protein n=1 Tax=Fusarium zealandicum TaxID=1053134 RepID=A0A8H4UKS6_9HYPO|nr:hypothetical protein FZEAL_5401 [Fusarium zealandicum]
MQTPIHLPLWTASLRPPYFGDSVPPRVRVSQTSAKVGLCCTDGELLGIRASSWRKAGPSWKHIPFTQKPVSVSKSSTDEQTQEAPSRKGHQKRHKTDSTTSTGSPSSTNLTSTDASTATPSITPPPDTVQKQMANSRQRGRRSGLQIASDDPRQTSILQYQALRQTCAPSLNRSLVGDEPASMPETSVDTEMASIQPDTLQEAVEAEPEQPKGEDAIGSLPSLEPRTPLSAEMMDSEVASLPETGSDHNQQTDAPSAGSSPGKRMRKRRRKNKKKGSVASKEATEGTSDPIMITTEETTAVQSEEPQAPQEAKELNKKNKNKTGALQEGGNGRVDTETQRDFTAPGGLTKGQSETTPNLSERGDMVQELKRNPGQDQTGTPQAKLHTREARPQNGKEKAQSPAGSSEGDDDSEARMALDMEDFSNEGSDYSDDIEDLRSEWETDDEDMDDGASDYY